MEMRTQHIHTYIIFTMCWAFARYYVSSYFYHHFRDEEIEAQCLSDVSKFT